MLDKHPHYVVFNGKSLADFGVYISGNGTFGTAERDYETVQVPGKNGDLLFDNGRFSNTAISYPAWIAEDFNENYRELASFLMSDLDYHRLEDTYHPDEYRLAYFTGGMDPSVFDFIFGAFNLTFTCKPQRFLKIGENPVEFTSSGTIDNPSSLTAKPQINVYGHGEITIGDRKVVIAENPYPYICIDSELFDCYAGFNANANSYVTLEKGFPELPKGRSSITIHDSTVTKLEIIPRWWRL